MSKSQPISVWLIYRQLDDGQIEAKGYERLFDAELKAAEAEGWTLHPFPMELTVEAL